jgi:hypothetical protein
MADEASKMTADIQYERRSGVASLPDSTEVTQAASGRKGRSSKRRPPGLSSLSGACHPAAVNICTCTSAVTCVLLSCGLLKGVMLTA